MSERATAGERVIPRIVPTPLPAAGAAPRAGRPRALSADVLAALLPGPGRDRLARGASLVVTTGQQPGLFTGPLYTVYKALSAIAWARRLERERGTPVVPVFWVAGDDHDFAEANHTWLLDAHGEAVRVVLRERAADAPLRPLWREPCGDEVLAALALLRERTPDTEFKPAVLEWLSSAYRPDATLADAFALALNALLAPRGLAVFSAHAPGAKRAMAPWLMKGLAATLPDGYTPVLVEGTAGRDRLRVDGDAFVTRRSGQRYSRGDLERIAAEHPELLSPNVLLRPVVEAALFPTVAYAAGPGELGYLPDARTLYPVLGDGVEPQAAVARWSGVLLEHRVEKVLERYGLTVAAFADPPGVLEARLARESLPPEIVARFAELRSQIEQGYGRLAEAVIPIDPTLERTVQSARNSALGGTHDIEKKLVAALRRANETLGSQIARARAALYPGGKPQERVLTLASFLIRYGPALVDALEAEVARWADAS